VKWRDRDARSCATQKLSGSKFDGPAVGSSDWLEPSLHPFLSAPILITDVKKCVIKVRLEAQHCNDLLVRLLRIVPDDDLIPATQKPLALRDAIEASHPVISVPAEQMLTFPAVAVHCNPHTDEIIERDTSRRWSRCCRQQNYRNNCGNHGSNDTEISHGRVSSQTR
jgi:hypothetical protein